MQQLFRTTTAYRALAEGARTGEAHFTLVLFPDAVYLRAFLKGVRQGVFRRGGRVAHGAAHRRGELFRLSHLSFGGRKAVGRPGGRDLRREPLRPVEGTKKLFVLDAFQTVTPLVQNKLLKLLEEPPEGVFFLAGATAEHTVLPTVLSRANVRRVEPFSEQAVAGGAAADARRIARHRRRGGRVRRDLVRRRTAARGRRRGLPPCRALSCGRGTA